MPHSTPQPEEPEPAPSSRVRIVAAGSKSLFAYGTLMFPEILEALLGRVPTNEDAVAEGWRAVAIPGRSYPALVASPGRARGRLLLDLEPDEWRVIDAYEEDTYELRSVDVDTPRRAAVAYVRSTTEVSTDVSWDRDRFVREELSAFARQCVAWRARALLSATPPAFAISDGDRARNEQR